MMDGQLICSYIKSDEKLRTHKIKDDISASIRETSFQMDVTTTVMKLKKQTAEEVIPRTCIGSPAALPVCYPGVGDHVIKSSLAFQIAKEK